MQVSRRAYGAWMGHGSHVLLVSILVALGLSGCFDNPDPVFEQIDQQGLADVRADAPDIPITPSDVATTDVAPAPDGDGGGTPGDALADGEAAADVAPDIVPDVADSPDVPEVEDYPLPPPGAGFHRRGPFILDTQGRAILLHAVNVSASAKKAGDRLPWQSAEDFEDIAAAGFNGVRLLIFWAGVNPEPGTIDNEYLSAVKDRVDWAYRAGLFVVIDMHQDLFGEGFDGDGAPEWACDSSYYSSYTPQTPWYLNYFSEEVSACFDEFYDGGTAFDEFERSWVAVATRFATHTAVVGFDLLNEPHWGSAAPSRFVPDVWQPLMERVAASIRTAAPRKIVFFQGTRMSSAGTVDLFDPADDPRTGLAPHYYHPIVLEGGSYNTTMFNDVVQGFDAIETMASRLGDVPVFLGEMGAPVEVPTSLRYLEDVLVELATRGWGWALWSDDKGNSGFRLRSANGELRSDWVDRLGHPYARRIPGTLFEQSLSLVTGRYTARFRWERNAPLEVWSGLPSAYPNGTSVTITAVSPSAAPVSCGPQDGTLEPLRFCPRPGTAQPPTFGAEYELVVEPVPAE